MTPEHPWKHTRTTDEHVRRARLSDASTHEVFLPINWVRACQVGVRDSLTAWEDGRLAELPVGVGWDIVRLPRTEGWETVRQLRCLRAVLGPVLHTRYGVDVLVPAGSATVFDLPDAAVIGAGETVEVPHPSVIAPHTCHARSWIVPPRDLGGLTESADLYGAYAAALASVRGGRRHLR